MATETKPNVIEYVPKRHIPVPEPMPGWVILKKEDVDTGGRVLLPTSGVTGMETTSVATQGGYKKCRVVKCSEEFPFIGTEVRKTPFAPGDYVLLTQGARGVEEGGLAIMLPPDHFAVKIMDLAGWTPCPMDQTPKAKS